MTDYISREAAIGKITDLINKSGKYTAYESGADDACYIVEHEIPAADVVSRDCYNRILEENDAMREQLAAVGKKPGDKMDDVVKVVRCGECFHITDHDCPISWPKNENDFCSYGERRDK